MINLIINTSGFRERRKQKSRSTRKPNSESGTRSSARCSLWSVAFLPSADGFPFLSCTPSVLFDRPTPQQCACYIWTERDPLDGMQMNDWMLYTSGQQQMAGRILSQDGVLRAFFVWPYRCAECDVRFWNFTGSEPHSPETETTPFSMKHS